MMAVEGSDGQQYVVLEVIQLAEGEEQAMVVGTENSDGIVGMDGAMQDGGKKYCLMIVFLLYASMSCLFFFKN